jgi:hypothetical protein
MARQQIRFSPVWFRAFGSTRGVELHAASTPHAPTAAISKAARISPRPELETISIFTAEDAAYAELLI